MWKKRFQFFIQWSWPSLFSAVLMALAFPPYSVWPLAFVALIPFLYNLVSADQFKQALIVSLTMSVAIVFTGFYWVGDVAVNFAGFPWIVGKIVLILFSLFGELQLFIFGIVAFYLIKHVLNQKNKIAMTLLILPILYAGLDAIYPKIFPNTFGHALYGWFSLAQIAEYGGVFSLTFLILVSNVALAFWIHPRARSQIRRKYFVVAIAAWIVATTLGSLWGKNRIAKIEEENRDYSTEFKVAMIQANIGDIDKLASERGVRRVIDVVLNKYKEMSLKAKKDFSPDLIVWPETAYPLLYTNHQNPYANLSGSARDDWVEGVQKELNIPLAFGGYSTDGKRDYNSIFLIDRSHTLVGTYRKTILLAFGEYVPLGPLAPFVQDLVPSIADFGRGTGALLFETDNQRSEKVHFTPQICYEGIIPEFTRQAALIGANFILNVTNDSWFGASSEPWIHLLITGFRSIELRLPLIRSTNTGYSAWFDRAGYMHSRSSLFADENIYFTLFLPKEGTSKPLTFFAKYGDIFGQTCAFIASLISFYVCIIAWKRKRTRNKPQR